MTRLSPMRCSRNVITVHPRTHLEVVRTGDLVRGDDPRADDVAALETLAFRRAEEALHFDQLGFPGGESCTLPSRANPSWLGVQSPVSPLQRSTCRYASDGAGRRSQDRPGWSKRRPTARDEGGGIAPTAGTRRHTLAGSGAVPSARGASRPHRPGHCRQRRLTARSGPSPSRLSGRDARRSDLAFRIAVRLRLFLENAPSEIFDDTVERGAALRTRNVENRRDGQTYAPTFANRNLLPLRNLSTTLRQ